MPGRSTRDSVLAQLVAFLKSHGGLTHKQAFDLAAETVAAWINTGSLDSYAELLGRDPEAVIGEVLGMDLAPPAAVTPMPPDDPMAATRAIRWVADNLHDRRIKRSDAPSGLAWNLLQFARAEPKDFWKLWAARFAKPDEEERKRFVDDGRDLTAMLDEFEAAVKAKEEKAGESADGG